MIGLAYICEEKGIIYNVTNASVSDLIEDIYSEEIILDDFNFHENSFQDYVDYLEFQEYSSFVFVTANKSPRIIQIIEFIKEFLPDITFHVIDKNVGHIYGPETINGQSITIKSLVENCQLYKQETELAMRNGLMALFTGLYPDNIRNNLIKHIFIESEELLSNIEQDVILNCALNCGIYIKNNQFNKFEKSIPLIIIPNQYHDKSILNSFTEFDEKKLYKLQVDFLKSGKCYFEEDIKGVFDYASIVGLEKNNRLFYYKDGIYQDFLKRKKISNDLNVSFFTIVLNINKIEKSQLFEDLKLKNIKRIYPVILNLYALNSGSEINFVTPYNKSFYNVVQDSVNINWIGFYIEDKAFAYSLKSNRLFETNMLFLKILDADYKGLLDKFIAEFEGDSEAVLREYKEVTNNG
ncbi:hypothetical protein ACLNGX_18865 [Bacillus velezensis]|uniref:hypothetical protein n=1 Tax=Bacillus amyloliquefaciens group TaxID=1938374 RepID=UPI00141931D7|nr:MULTISPECIES: hypothetical protein [Bacillus amyloliquefaciens group]MBI0441405.1 hypothetical protein [Bacillus velezensis]MCC9265195.1 hypothetical protein [Bacillus velezensis]NIH00432.1 hypothetical protein [Bacillus amyloliquefaciens]